MNRTRGFTLIELLVVIAIIGILSSVVLASLNSARVKARDARRVADIKQIQTANELYADSNRGSYASSTALLAPTYMSVIPTDPLTLAAYPYFAASTDATASTCEYYHLGATLEDTGNQALNNDADLAATSTAACTGGGTDFAGTDPVFDVRP